MNKYEWYEYEKRKLGNLSPDEYEKAILAIAKKLKI